MERGMMPAYRMTRCWEVVDGYPIMSVYFRNDPLEAADRFELRNWAGQICRVEPEKFADCPRDETLGVTKTLHVLSARPLASTYGSRVRHSRSTFNPRAMSYVDN